MALQPLFLISNDDGVHAPGIRALANVARGFGDVFVAAPHVERSASSQAITIAMPLRMEELHAGVYAIEGTPADCVMMALQQILPRRPSWVLSGINRGGNLGTDTLYSGTVGAAMEGFITGCRAMAVSVEGREPLHYDTAAQVVKILLENEDKLDVALDGVLNVNVPNRPFRDIKGIEVASLGRRVYAQQMQVGMDPRGRQYFWIGGGGRTHEDIAGSDCVLLEQGYVTISVLKPDLLHPEATERLRQSLPKMI